MKRQLLLLQSTYFSGQSDSVLIVNNRTGEGFLLAPVPQRLIWFLPLSLPVETSIHQNT